MSQPCHGAIYRGGFANDSCRRAGTIEENGQTWCWQHAPSHISRREVERDARREQEIARAIVSFNEREAAETVKRRRAEAFPALLDAAKAVLEWYQYMPVNRIYNPMEGEAIAKVRAAIAMAEKETA